MTIDEFYEAIAEMLEPKPLRPPAEDVRSDTGTHTIWSRGAWWWWDKATSQWKPRDGIPPTREFVREVLIEVERRSRRTLTVLYHDEMLRRAALLTEVANGE